MTPDPDALLDGPTLALFLGIPRWQLHNWTRTGRLKVRARDARRRALYRIGDVQTLARHAPGRGRKWVDVVYSEASPVTPARKHAIGA